MTTLADMTTGNNGVQQRLMIANNSGLIPPARITTVVQDEIKWAGSLFYWPSLQRLREATALKNTQGLNYDYYDYPIDFLRNSIARLYIDGKLYLPKAYQDFLDYADSSIDPTLSPNPANHFFANYGDQFFTYPSYSGIAPANNLLGWGNIEHPLVTDPAGTTIFSNWDENGNKAIVKKAMSTLLERIDPPMANALESEAIGMLQLIWKRVTDEAQKAQRLNHQFFQVPDYFGFGGGLSTIGNFNIPVDVENYF